MNLAFSLSFNGIIKVLKLNTYPRDICIYTQQALSFKHYTLAKQIIHIWFRGTQSKSVDEDCTHTHTPVQRQCWSLGHWALPSSLVGSCCCHCWPAGKDEDGEWSAFGRSPASGGHTLETPQRELGDEESFFLNRR